MVNDIIDGKYQIISKIGSGGTSIVYKAKRIADDQLVAIKVIRDELDNIREHERHFHLEAEALYKMSHRNIRRILGVGRWNDSLYMVTEFIDGLTLKDMVSGGALPIKQAVDYALQIAAGIEHAHRKNIIHRDIKPQNIIVANDGTVKIVDFGIARMTSQTTRTMAGKDVIGSVHYLSPEQARGAQVDNRSDIYSFGILLYEMFTGRVPFEGTEAVSIAMRHVNQIPEPPQSVNPDITSGINDIIVKCIQKDPANRYQTASELREDLLLYVANPDGFSVMKAEKLQGRESGENEPDVKVVKTRRSTEFDEDFLDEPKKIRKKVSYVSDDERKKAHKIKRKRIMAITAGVVFSLVIIILSIKLIPTFFADDTKYPEREIPYVSGYSKGAAVALLNVDEFSKFNYIYEASNSVKEGDVIRTDPSEGTITRVNTEISIYISTGPEKLMAHNTVGKNLTEAETLLKEQGFVVKVNYVTNPEKTNGVVIEQSNSTELVRYGDTIVLTVVRNMESATAIVPDILNMTDVEEIKKKITDAGFKVGEVKENVVNNIAKVGVTYQSVEAGKEYVYVVGGELPDVYIDFDINIYKPSYKCVYEYETPDNAITNMFLIVYDAMGNELKHFTYNSTNKAICELDGNEGEVFVFELYVNDQLVDKESLVTQLVQGE